MEKEEQLYSCYKSSLKLAEIKGCKSIAFPLISSGAYGCPKEKALTIAQKAIRDHLKNHDMNVFLVLFDKSAVNVSQKLKFDIQSYIDDKYSEEHYPSEAEEQRARFNISGSILFALRNRSARYAGVAPDANIAAILKYINKPDFSFSQKLFQLIDERGMTDPEVYMRANLSKQVFSKIRLPPEEEHHTCARSRTEAVTGGDQRPAFLCRIYAFALRQGRPYRFILH